MKLEDYRHYLPTRHSDAHKGDFGHVLVVGGNIGLSGAPTIAALGAARVGAGLVTIASHPNHSRLINLTQPEIMASAIFDENDKATYYKQATVIVVGPGLGQTPWSKVQLQTVLSMLQPLVVDADALNLLARHHQQYKDKKWILTPHPGEAARLLQTDSKTIQANRLQAAKTLQQHYGGVVVLKGANTLVVSSTDIKQCEAGNPGMASGGMGDLLAGIIGGLLAQRLPLAIAAQCGVCLHAKAGDLVAKQYGQRGMLATDLLPYIRKLVNFI